MRLLILACLAILGFYPTLFAADPSAGTGAAISDADIHRISVQIDQTSSIDSDGNGLEDAWEDRYFGHIRVDPSADPDGDELTNLQEFQKGTTPTSYYEGTEKLTIVSGNNQTGPSGSFLPLPLIVQLKKSDGSVMGNAPIMFPCTEFYGKFSPTPDLALARSDQEVRTDANGFAQMYFWQPKVAGSTNLVEVWAGLTRISFRVSTLAHHGSPAAASNLKAEPAIGRGKVNLTWMNNADNANFNVIAKSTDRVHWTAIALLDDPSQSAYVARGLTLHQGYYFSVTAVNDYNPPVFIIISLLILAAMVVGARLFLMRRSTTE